MLPELNALMSKKCHNYAGKICVANPELTGTICHVVVQLPQVRHCSNHTYKHLLRAVQMSCVTSFHKKKQYNKSCCKNSILGCHYLLVLKENDQLYKPRKCYLRVTHVNYPDQNETEQQAQPGSKLGKALQNLGIYGSCQFRNYLKETGLQKPSDQEGTALFFPQRKVLITH
jgi:hypothetical protein